MVGSRSRQADPQGGVGVTAFTDSPFVLVQAEEQHRGHAGIEQVFAELIDGPLAHLPQAGSTPTTPG